MTTTIVKSHYQDTTVAADYDRERFTSLPGRLFDVLEKRTLRRAFRYVLSGGPIGEVLDAPCGTGRITELLLEEGFDVVGGDISEQMMDVARAKCDRFAEKVRFRRLDLDALDLPAASHELVTCVRLFHHLDSASRAQVLSELARVSRRFVLVNVSLSTPWYRLRRRLKRLVGQAVSRESSTWRQIRAEAEGAGLRLHRRFYVARGLSEDLVLLMTVKDAC